MNDFFKYVNIVSAVLPLVRQAVSLVEDLAKDLPGETKKNLALGMLRDVITTLKNDPNIKIKELDLIPFDLVLGLLNQIIDIVVSVFNSTIWKKD